MESIGIGADLEAGYQAMAADEVWEAEADEWSENLALKNRPSGAASASDAAPDGLE